MPSTTHAHYKATTDGTTVATAFKDHIKGRTILITGVNRLGLGYTTAAAFASQSPVRIICTGRSPSKLQESTQALSAQYPDVDVRPLALDLSSFESIRRAANELLDWSDIPAIDILVNNAGIMNIPKRTLSEDGIEMHFATNHVGHFLFTNLIMPKILAAAQRSEKGATRIISVSSIGTYVSPPRFSDLGWEKPSAELPDAEKPNLAQLKAAGLVSDDTVAYLPMAAYGHSKTANILFAAELKERLFEKYGVLAISLHPGEIGTELARSTDKEWLSKVKVAREKLGFLFKTPEQGASTVLVAALDPELADNAANEPVVFLNDCQMNTPPPPPPYSRDTDNAKRLWGATEKLVAQEFLW